MAKHGTVGTLAAATAEEDKGPSRGAPARRVSR